MGPPERGTCGYVRRSGSTGNSSSSSSSSSSIDCGSGSGSGCPAVGVRQRSRSRPAASKSSARDPASAVRSGGSDDNDDRNMENEGSSRQPPARKVHHVLPLPAHAARFLSAAVFVAATTCDLFCSGSLGSAMTQCWRFCHRRPRPPLTNATNDMRISGEKDTGRLAPRAGLGQAGI